MAKQPQDDTSDKPATSREGQFGVREGQFGRDQFSRESQSAARDAQSSMRHAQQAVTELTASALLQPYAELMQEMGNFNREWAQRMRSSVERTLDLTLKLQETWISQVKQASDLYLRVFEADLSAQTAMTRELQDRTASAVRRYGTQAAE